jgi:magnesium-transporting ATPase (P-type)
MVVNYKHLGAILGSIGSSIELMIGLMVFSHAGQRILYWNFYLAIIDTIAGITMVLIGVFGTFGSILAFKNETRGYKYLLSAGAFGVIGTLIPIGIFVYPLISPLHPGISNLVTTYYYFELILMVIGGVLGLALAEKKEKKEHTNKYWYLGAVLGLIGSLILFIIALFHMSFFHYNLYNSYQEILVIGIVTLLISMFGIFGSLVAIRDDPKGYIYLLIAGVIGFVGTFFPIFSSESTWG